MIELILLKRELYGRFVYYPGNEAAKLVCQLTGTKTVRDDDFKALQALGFVLTVQPYDGRETA